MSVSDFGKATQSLQVSNLEVMGHGSSSTSGSIHASGNISGRLILNTSVQTGSTVTTYTITPSDILGGIINHSAAGSTFTFPTATLLIAAIPRAKVGMTLPLLIANTGAGTVTIAMGTGGTFVGAALTIATTVHSSYWIRISSVTAGALAYVVYRVNAS